MDYAEAIDTQRDALLRLLARLVVAVEILSCALFADHAPRWARELIGSILFRAEVAANSLVIASMRGLVQRGFGDRASVALAAAKPAPYRGSEGGVSLGQLRVRIGALRKLLKSLPQAARRRLRIAERLKSASRLLQVHEVPCFAPYKSAASSQEMQGFAPRIDRPPD